jgi:hypothetical protein
LWSRSGVGSTSRDTHFPISKAPAWCGSIRKRNWDSCGAWQTEMSAGSGSITPGVPPVPPQVLSQIIGEEALQGRRAPWRRNTAAWHDESTRRAGAQRGPSVRKGWPIRRTLGGLAGLLRSLVATPMLRPRPTWPSCVGQVLQNRPWLFPTRIASALADRISPRLARRCAARSSRSVRKSAALWLSPSLVMISRMASSESWSGCLFSARAIIFTLQRPAIRAAISALARRPATSPSSIRTICRNRCSSKRR